MPPPALPLLGTAASDGQAASLHIRVQRRIGSAIYSFVGSAPSDSNATMSGLAGPGRPLGQLFSVAGRRLEAVVDRTTARAGLGFEGIARRLLMKLRSPHIRCRAWAPEFAKTPVLDLAIELGSGRCAGCNQRYMGDMGSVKDREVGELLLRLVSSLESDLSGNRTTGSMLLTALALSEDSLLAALRAPQVLQRVELSLHSCKIFTVHDAAWLPALRAVDDLRLVLTSIVPVEPSAIEPYTYEGVLRIWQELRFSASVLQGLLRTLPLMSSCVALRLTRISTVDKDLLQGLCKPSNRAHLTGLYVHALSTCSESNRKDTGRVLGAAALLNAEVTPALLAALLQLPLLEVVVHLQTFVTAHILVTENPWDLISDGTTLRTCHESLCSFVISIGQGHESLIDCCLSLLNKELRQDMCDIRNAGLANADVPDLRARMARAVPEALRYACLSWPVHLVAIGSISGTVSATLREFCRAHLLHWLEVLSLLGELSSAGKHFERIIQWCQVADIACTKELTRLFSGVQRALQLYATPITSHALQIYQSFRATSLERGLEYVPNDYIIRPRIVSQTTSDWSSISPVIEGHLDCVNSVAYSSDGARVVSGSSDMTVRVWDAQAGKQLSVLKGHSNWVLSAEFSSDAAHIVSGSSDRTVRVWDVSTSKQLTG